MICLLLIYLTLLPLSYSYLYTNNHTVKHGKAITLISQFVLKHQKHKLKNLLIERIYHGAFSNWFSRFLPP